MKTFLKILFFFLLVTQICFTQWVQTNGPYGGGEFTCFAIADTNLFAGTLGSGVFLSTNNGISWIAVSTGLTDFNITSLLVSGANLFAGTEYSGVFVSTNNGKSWGITGLTSTDITALAASGTNIFAGASYGKGVFLSTDNGTSWTEVNTGLTNTYVWSLAVSGTNLFAGTGNGVFVSSNNGANWTAVNDGLPIDQYGSPPSFNCFAVSGTNLFAGTSRGVFRWINSGTSWTAVSTVFADTSISALIVSDTNFYAGSYWGVRLSTNNGNSWSVVNSGLTSYQLNINALTLSGTNLFAGTQGGLVFSTNSGTSWNEVDSGLTCYSVASIATSGTNLFAGINFHGGMFLSTNNGTNWTRANAPFSGFLEMIETGENLFAGTYEGVFLSTNNGNSWTQASTGLTDTNVQALAARGTSLLAGTPSGVFLSTNNGTSWTAAGLNNHYVSALIVSGPNVFAATGDSVFVSTNNGASWIAVNNGFPPDPNIMVLATAGENIFVGSSGYRFNIKWYTPGHGVFLSTNDGTSWTQVNTGLTDTSVSALVVSGTDLFARTPSGVFLSTNNGTSWTAVNDGLTNTNVLSLAVSGTNLFAGTWRSGIWRRPLSELVPVELTTFTATTNNKEAILSWSTATELNNQGFEVQRKFGSNDFVTIGSVKGHGTTTSSNQYTFVDKLVDAGKYFYRLKQIDFGGKYEYSQTVEINWSPFSTYKLEQNFPNPLNPSTTIGFGIPEKGNVRLSVLNILGEEIKILLNEEKEAGYHSIDFNGSDLPSGVYFYRLQTGNFIDTKKMILLK